ncbi:MAG: MerR family transcriptional regulator [Lacrimispora sp.]|jgi:DNA-binding transcriptional MerR regulator/effector-binding domain-containing protein|nr:MerR family transcriptional regulator [Lacrimispora sp.]
MGDEIVTISEMARLHHLTRQTLIYYDHIGLLKPVSINEHGYRYYSVYQIPVLREICLLKKFGVKLEDIKRSFENRSPDTVINLLELQKDSVDKQIHELKKTKMHLEQRIGFYEDLHEEHPILTPLIKEIGPRKILFVPFPCEPCKNILHLTLMRAWNQLFDWGTVPSIGFGTLIRSSQFDSEDLYRGSGIFVVVPDREYNFPGIEEIPGGIFACMYKYSFPYYKNDFFTLKEWAESQGYDIIGDALDLCLLDTTFYNTEHEVDYCCLQIPVKKKVSLT